MCRFPLSIRFLVALTLLTCGAAQGFAQGNAARRAAPDGKALLEIVNVRLRASSGFDARTLAKARFEACRTDPKQRFQEQVEAAQASLLGPLEELRAGTKHIGVFAEIAGETLKLLATDAPPGERALLLKQRWGLALEAECFWKDMLEIAPRVREILVYARRTRLEAEVSWIESRKEAGASKGILFLIERQEAPRALRLRAQAEFAARNTGSHQHNRARLAAAREVLSLSWRDFVSGPLYPPEALLDALGRYNEAEAALPGPATNAPSVWQNRWERVWIPLWLLRTQIPAGSPSSTKEAMMRARLLKIQAGWVRALRAAPVPLPANAPVLHLSLRDRGIGTEQAAGLVRQVDSRVAKRLAHDLFEASRSNPRAVEVECVEAAQRVFQGRFVQFLSESINLAQLMDSLEQLLETELVLAGTAADRATILEHHWILRLAVEKIVKARFDAGSKNLAELAQARHYRLEAETRWQKALDPSKR